MTEYSSAPPRPDSAQAEPIPSESHPRKAPRFASRPETRPFINPTDQAPAGTRPQRRTGRVRRWLKGVMTAASLAFTAAVGAVTVQDAPNLDLNGTGSVSALARDPVNGYLYAGGEFEVAGSGLRNLIRFNPNGSLDATWAPNPDGVVRSLALDAAGDLYVGGNFSTVGGEPRRALAKVPRAGDGTPQAGWAPDPALYGGIPDGIEALAVDSSGRVYVGGYFHHIAGELQPLLARLTPDGALDGTWRPELGDYVLFTGFAPAFVMALALDADETNVYVGGSFISVGDNDDLLGLARIPTDGDGSPDPDWFVPDLGPVAALAMDPHGYLYAAAINHFPLFAPGGETVVRLATESPAQPTPVWELPVGDVDTLAVDHAGSLYVGGDFTTVGGEARSGLAQVSTSDGTVDPTWDPAPDGAVSALLLDNAGTLVVGGEFATIGGVAREAVAGLSVIALTMQPTNTPEPGSLTARVNEGPSPVTGTVTFVDANGTPIAGCTDLTLDTNGEATCPASALGGDTAGVAVTFTGSGAYAGVSASTAPPIIHAIPLLAPWAFALLAAGLFGFGARRLRRAVGR